MDINSNDIHFDNSCSFKNGILPDRNVSANAGSIFLQLTSIQSSHVTLSAWGCVKRSSQFWDSGQ